MMMIKKFIVNSINSLHTTCPLLHSLQLSTGIIGFQMNICNWMPSESIWSILSF